tara:strand:- start:467 stop:1021 length:555 start_codon:yes stop_codon:yes gene_type:complete
MNLSLFIVVLGGRSLKSNIELHDVRWVIGEKLEDTFPELREQWFGESIGLHIDSYKCIKYIDGYEIIISKYKNTLNSFEEKDLKLWFVNLGGYNPKKMYEEHEFRLIVAKNAADAKKIAKYNWESNLKIKHNDNLSSIKSFKQIDDFQPIRKFKNWEIKLLSDPEKRSDKLIPDWYGYMRIDKL